MTAVAQLWSVPQAQAERLLGLPEVAELLGPDRPELALSQLGRRARLRLAGRLLARVALARLSWSDPREFLIADGPWGRPELSSDHGDLHFSVSHSAGVTACLATREVECGLDIERSPVSSEVLALAPRYLADAEYAWLETAATDRRPALAAQLWSLREAYTKALGCGLTRPTNSFAFGSLDARPITVRDDALSARECRSWSFELTHRGKGLVTAVALNAAVGHAPPVVAGGPLDTSCFTLINRMRKGGVRCRCPG